MMRKLDLNSPQFKQKLVRTLIQNTPVAYILLDRSYRVQFVNDHLLRTRNMSREDVLGKICYDICNDGIPCPNCAIRDAISSGQCSRILRKDVCPDGTIIFKDDLAVPITIDGMGELVLEVQIDRTLEIQSKEKTNYLFLDTFLSMIEILKQKDPYTCQHSRDVSAISSKLTWYMGLDDKAIFNATLGGLLHDLGKLHVPDNVLNKSGKLDGREYAIIKEHPLFTYLLLPDLKSFKSIRDIAIAHHEKWDGTGYPNGLKGENIPIEARIASIADSYSAMTSDRPYRKGLGHEIAVAEIRKYSGTQFDPDIVEKFFQMTDEFALDKDTLTQPDESDLVQTLNRYQYSQRYLSRAGHPGASANSYVTDSEIDELASTDPFINAIFDNTPAAYMVVDDSYNVLYISENFALAFGKDVEDLVNKKCFDVTGRKMYCFGTENGKIRCPVARCFQTGEGQFAMLKEYIGGQTFYIAAYAIPIELEDINGETFKCCLEIMFDRTKEKNAQIGFENDLKQIISAVYNLISELELDVSGNLADISAEAQSLCDYLSKMQKESAEITTNSENV